jgi:hypothetical protein
LITSFQVYIGGPQFVSDCRRPTPDTWNLERPACFEIVPTAARSGAGRQICTARDHVILQCRACARQGTTSCLRTKSMTRSRASTGRLCAVLDFHPGQSPERSPLHDVRQHAPRRANPAGCENVYFWTSRALGHDMHKTAMHRVATRMKRKKAAAHAERDQGAATADLVEPDGIEPTTSCLQSRRSPN